MDARIMILVQRILLLGVYIGTRHAHQPRTALARLLGGLARSWAAAVVGCVGDCLFSKPRTHVHAPREMLRAGHVGNRLDRTTTAESKHVDPAERVRKQLRSRRCFAARMPPSSGCPTDASS